MNSGDITVKAACLATYDYLSRLHQRTQSEPLGVLLSEMSLLEDDTTADPAAWSDWLDSVRRATTQHVDANLHLQ
jgi:hypothetical protein